MVEQQQTSQMSWSIVAVIYSEALAQASYMQDDTSKTYLLSPTLLLLFSL
jgi:hypothetical protein